MTRDDLIKSIRQELSRQNNTGSLNSYDAGEAFAPHTVIVSGYLSVDALADVIIAKLRGLP